MIVLNIDRGGITESRFTHVSLIDLANDGSPTEPTRQAATAAFAKSWRRE
jgi:hypothetical protein